MKSLFTLIQWQQFVASAVLTLVLSLFLPFVIPILVPENSDFLIFLLACLFFVIALTLFIVLSSAILYRVSQHCMQYLEEKKNRDIVIKKRKKSVYINKDMFDRQVCRITDSFIMKNYTGQVYHDYLIKMESDGTFPSVSDYTFRINDEEFQGDESKTPSQKYTRISNGKTTNGVEIHIPVNIVDDKEECHFSISHSNSDNMDKLFNCLDVCAKEDDCKEYLSIRVNHRVEKLELSCIISPELQKEGYCVVPKIHCFDAQFKWEVLDASMQPMWNYQKMLSQTKATPLSSKEGVRWIIYNPRIGYQYKLYFSLSKK